MYGLIAHYLRCDLLVLGQETVEIVLLLLPHSGRWRIIPRLRFDLVVEVLVVLFRLHRYLFTAARAEVTATYLLLHRRTLWFPSHHQLLLVSHPSLRTDLHVLGRVHPTHRHAVEVNLQLLPSALRPHMSLLQPRRTQVQLVLQLLDLIRTPLVLLPVLIDQSVQLVRVLIFRWLWICTRVRC